MCAEIRMGCQPVEHLIECLNVICGRFVREGETVVLTECGQTVVELKATPPVPKKVDIGLAKGKKQHDKRHSEKEREWNREKQRLMRDK